MKTYAVWITGPALIMSVLLQGSPAALNGDLDRILSNMQQAAKKVNTIEATMHHEKRHGQIGGKGESYRGTIFFKHGGPNVDKVRINYEVSKQVIVVDGNRITLYQPAINQVIITCRKALAKESEEFSFFETPYTSVPQLETRFDIVYVRDEKIDSSSTSIIELTPKKKANAKKLTLWIDQSSWLPIKYRVIEQNDDVSTFTLSDIKLNVNLGGDTFRISWPDHTKVVREPSC